VVVVRQQPGRKSSGRTRRRATRRSLGRMRRRAASGILYVQVRLPDVAQDGSLAVLAGRLQELRVTCRAAGGSLVVEQCPVALKGMLDVWGDGGSAFSLMKRLKASLDPNRIMNPGRFVGGI